MSTYLPTEALESILFTLEEDLDLVNCCLVSRLFLRIVRPYLYSSLFVRIDQVVDFLDEQPILTDYLDSKTAALLHSLNNNSYLTAFVRTLVFSGKVIQGVDRWSYEEIECGDGGSVEDDEDGFMKVDGQEILRNLLEILQNLESICLNDPCDIGRIDRVVRLAQTSRPIPGVTLNVVEWQTQPRKGHLPEDEWTLQAAYDVIRIAPCGARSADDLVSSSLHRVRTLSIPLAFFRDTSKMPNLASLKIVSDDEFDEDYDDWTQAEWDIECSKIVEAVKNLSSTVTTLILQNLNNDPWPRFPDYSSLAQGIAEILPPTLVSVSFHRGFRPPNLAQFVRNLPGSSQLDRLNIFPKPSPREAVDFEAECEKRGIDRSYNEIWEI
ncbi:hypothetical protein JCM5353_005080 [Sporobolomyces roseus]